MAENVGGYKVITLDNLDGGQVVALFDREIKKLLENIADQNTPAKSVRALTIKIKIKPEENREQADIEISAESKLAGVTPSKSIIVFAFDGDTVTAYQSAPPVQLNLKAESVDEVAQRKAGGA